MMVRVLIVAALLSMAAPAAAEPVLTLEEAVAQALHNRFELLAADARIDAVRSAGEQAGAWPNPAGFLRLEAAPRDGNAWSGSERIVGLSQALPIGGRTGAARRAAAAGAARVSHERDVLRREVEAEVRKVYAETVHAQAELALRREAADVALRLLDIVSVRVDQGDAPASDRRRATMAAGTAEAELAAAEAADEAARIRLAGATGNTRTSVAAVSGETARIVPQDLPELLAGLDTAPRTRAAAGRIDEREALAGLAARSRIPDLELEAGLRTAPDGDSFDLGVRVDVPIFDRGGARLSAAKAEARTETYLAQAARRNLEAGLRSVHATLVAADRGADIYSRSVVPEARAALRSAEAAYAAGETGLTEVLLARRAWLEARLAHIGLRRDAATAHAELIALL